MSERKGPLTDLTVIDLTTFLSGPYATQIFGDLGADVIKVEAPGRGDSTRILPPHMVHGDSAYFHSTNRNKRSVCIDLKKPEGRDLLLKLAQKADILIENFRPGVMKRLDLEPETLEKLNPRLIYCSLSGFGQNGPYRDHPAYDMIVQALSGGMSMTGEKGGRAVRAGVPLGDLAAGMYAVIGSLAAVAERARTGRGQYIDVAMLDAQISMLSYQAQYYLVSGNVPGRQGAQHDSIPTYRSFVCADGEEVVITANTEGMWKGLCEVLDLTELTSDPRFLDNRLRLINRSDLWEILEPAFAQRSVDEWLPLLIDAGIPTARVNTVDKALAQPQVAERNMVTEASAPDGRTIRVTGNPVKMPAHGEGAFAMPPRLGEHTQAVLQELLALSPDDIEALAAKGIVALDVANDAKAGDAPRSVATGGRRG